MGSSISRLRNILARRSVTLSPGRSGKAARPRFRSSLDFLEERCLLTTFTVTRLTDKSADSSPGELRTIIANARAGDTINFAKGLSGTIKLNAGLGILNINLDPQEILTINGPGANVITISGQNQIPVFASHFGNLTISGLTITGASNLGINAEGGAIYNEGGGLLLQNTILTGNQASFGGGVYNTDGGLVVLDLKQA